MLIWADKKFRLGHGRVMWLYVAGYTFGRFFIELMRTDEANTILGLRVNTWVSGIVFIVGLILFFRAPKGRETPAEVDPGFYREQHPKELGESAQPTASGTTSATHREGETRYGGQVEDGPQARN